MNASWRTMRPTCRWCGLAFLGILWQSGLLQAQGVLLPPIGQSSQQVSAQVKTNSGQGKKPVDPGDLKLPGDSKEPPKDLQLPKEPQTVPLGKPPTLGEPNVPGDTVGQPIPGGPPLTLLDVLASVDRHYPLIFAAEQERCIAEGRALAARGALDVNLRSEEYFAGETYDNQRYSLLFSQQTPLMGLSYFAGYRLGAGSYPVYQDDRRTAEGGEFRAGMILPLLRNRDLDAARARIAQAEIDRKIAEPTIQLQRIDIARMATQTYWLWVAAGQRYLLAREILRVAENRDELINGRVKAGTLPAIEREDNRRLIADRRARLTVAERAFQQAAILLSQYLRDDKGCPLITTTDRLPAFTVPPPPPTGQQREEALKLAIQNRPEIQRLILQQQRLRVELDLASNQLLPGLNLGVQGAQDIGAEKKGLYRSYGEVALIFDVPLQRRDSRGKIIAAKGELARLHAQEQFARDRVQLEVQNALNALDRAYELLERGRDNRLQTAYLEEAERKRFEIGTSDLLRLNIRELQTFDARLLEIDAAAEFYRALAEYKAVLGIDPSRGL